MRREKEREKQMEGDDGSWKRIGAKTEPDRSRARKGERAKKEEISWFSSFFFFFFSLRKNKKDF